MLEWQLWVCAEKVLCEHGAQAPLFVVDRIGALTLAGDEVAVANWRDIARKVRLLRENGGLRAPPQPARPGKRSTRRTAVGS